MREAVLVSTARTPLAKSFRGSLNMTRPDDMVAHCLTHCLKKAPELDPEEIEDIIIGCANPEGTQGVKRGPHLCRAGRTSQNHRRHYG